MNGRRCARSILIIVSALSVGSVIGGCSAGHSSQASTSTQDPAPTSGAAGLSGAAICGRLTTDKVMKAAGGSGAVTIDAHGTGNGSNCSFYTQDRLVTIVVTTVDRTTADGWRTSVFGRCGSLADVGVFALDCRDGRGVQVYLPANYLISVTANKVPLDSAANGVADHAETIAAAKVIADELS